MFKDMKTGVSIERLRELDSLALTESFFAALEDQVVEPMTRAIAPRLAMSKDMKTDVSIERLRELNSLALTESFFAALAQAVGVVEPMSRAAASSPTTMPRDFEDKENQPRMAEWAPSYTGRGSHCAGTGALERPCRYARIIGRPTLV